MKYQASYTSTLRYYNVTFKDEDENIIQVDGRDSNSYGYNTSITKLPAEPTKTATLPSVTFQPLGLVLKTK